MTNTQNKHTLKIKRALWIGFYILVSLGLWTACGDTQTANSNTPNKPKTKVKTAPKTGDVGETSESNNATSTKSVSSIEVAFYNVENLFDTQDDPKTDDQEFLPNGEKKWTTERYETKLDKLYKALSGDGSFPSIVGVSEIENRRVLEDWIKKTPIDDNYGICQFDSPDGRGIDVGMIYDKAVFKPKEQESLEVKFDFNPNVKTRDILYVEGDLQGEEVHIFVNHWSSRRGGLEASEPKRMACSKVLRNKLDAIYADNVDAKIIIMGDFNDETDNNSITKGLGAKANPENLKPRELFNLSAALDAQDKGTYNYKGTWNMLDQMIVSKAMVNGSEGMQVKIDALQIVMDDFLLYKDKRSGPRPNRTYGGPNYYGGFSDHLPIVAEFSIQ
ncbi:MAG: hypothetical protein ACPGXL_07375 [Chitinophagales bacterium]